MDGGLIKSAIMNHTICRKRLDGYSRGDEIAHEHFSERIGNG